jgi:hypothetical protein
MGVSTLALHKYKPVPARIAVSTTLFTTDTSFETGPTAIPIDDLLGWKTWIHAHLECQALHGNHLQIFSPERLDLVARVISDTIRGKTWSRTVERADQTITWTRPHEVWALVLPMVRNAPLSPLPCLELLRVHHGARSREFGIGFFCEAYWNGGWLAVILCSAAIGWLFAMITRVLGEELLLGNLWALPFALLWVRGGAQVDGWMHTEIVGPAVFTLIGILAMRYWLGLLEVRAAQAREQVAKVTSKLRNRRA